MQFEKQLKKLLKKSMSNQFTGDDRAWPAFIYDDFETPKLAETIKVKYEAGKNKVKTLLQEDKDKNKYINDCLKRFDIKGLSNTYDLLNDSYSKKLLVRIIAFRMLGPSKIKMPLTSRKPWVPYFEIKKLKQKQEISTAYYKFNLFDLKKIGYNFKLFYDDYSIFINFVLKQYEYSRGNYLCSATSGDYVIDGGACFGDTALFFANEVGPNGRVFSFEFVPDNLKLLRTNLNLNPTLKKRVTVVKNPLWSNSKENLFVVEYGPASTVTMKKPVKYDYKVKTKSIDDFVKAENIKKVDFIKMDIEGAELESVRGAQETIRKFKPKLAICLYHDIDHFVSIPKLVHELLPEYDLRLDHYTIHLGESVMYAVPKRPKMYVPVSLGSLRRNRNFVTEDIVVIDSVLPSKNPIGPRNSDLSEFTKRLPNFKYFTMYPMKPGKSAWFSHGYGMTKAAFKENMKAYSKLYPGNVGSLELLSEKKSYQINLAYTYFLAETYTLLPFLEKNKIPFVFLLNPGGAFGLNNKSSDDMLRDIFASKYFRKVIVNQKVFRDYLIKKKLCSSNNIIFDFSGSVQFQLADVVKKKYYKRDKKTFDICFVAAKYTDRGIDKGYDLFVESAKCLVKLHSDIRVHVVGGFNSNDIDVSDIRDHIKFYGYLPAKSLPKFYSRMDIYLSPNRSSILYEGNSDGFPLSAGAMYCGVCGVNSDELHLNTEFKNDEIIIIKNQTVDIVKKIDDLYLNPTKLYSISRKGQKKAQILYDEERHIEKRIKLFKRIIKENP